MNKISIIVPCYNEEESIGLFYRKTTEVLEHLVSCEEVDYEMLFVDDGSRDSTLDQVKKISTNDAHCRYISFSRNFGKEAGMYAGLSEAQGDYCVIMDADLQHPPELLPEMYQAVNTEGFDCCGGLRCGREGDGAIRSLCSRFFYHISKELTHMDMSDGHGDFRMMNRPVVDAILGMKEYNRYMKGLFSFVGFETKWIPYENVERAKGETKWTFKSLFSYAFEGILSFSTAPLKFAGVVGILLILTAVMGLLAGVDMILSIVLLVSGMQMIFIYILGAYISKDYMENKRRPVYIVKERG